MTSPAEKSYAAYKAELDADTTHPMAGTVIDEIIALERSGQPAAAEATRIAAATAFRETIAEWRRQAAEDVANLEGGEL